MSSKKDTPKAEDDGKREPAHHEEPGTNAVEHEPDPLAEPIADGEHKYIRKSPFTAGND